MVLIIEVKRIKQDEKTMLGELYINSRKLGYTLELSWRDNQRSISCIPAGNYSAFIRRAETSRWNYDVIQLNGVPQRDAIQIHKGNYHGDTDGCILPGRSHGVDADGFHAVWRSGDVFDEIMKKAKVADSIRVKVFDPS